MCKKGLRLNLQAFEKIESFSLQAVVTDDNLDFTNINGLVKSTSLL